MRLLTHAPDFDDLVETDDLMGALANRAALGTSWIGEPVDTSDQGRIDRAAGALRSAAGGGPLEQALATRVALDHLSGALV